MLSPCPLFLYLGRLCDHFSQRSLVWMILWLNSEANSYPVLFSWNYGPERSQLPHRKYSCPEAPILGRSPDYWMWKHYMGWPWGYIKRDMSEQYLAAPVSYPYSAVSYPVTIQLNSHDIFLNWTAHLIFSQIIDLQQSWMMIKWLSFL